MSAIAVGYPRDWSLEMNDDGHRDYTVFWPVQTTSVYDGPDIAITAPGLPTPGASLAIGNTIDPWAFYQRKGSAKLIKSRGNRKFWDVALHYTTLPTKRCQTNKIENPLMEPHRVSGEFRKYTAEATEDKDGDPLVNSAHERFKGPVVSRDFNRPSIHLEMNVAWLNLTVLAGYVDAVNDSTWWGQSARKIKCSEFDWQRVLYGTCNYYFIAKFTFELKEDTWDFKVLDEGAKILENGEAIQYKDTREENTTTLLDGSGQATTTPYYHEFRVYPEKDFSTVGWPASLM